MTNTELIRQEIERQMSLWFEKLPDADKDTATWTQDEAKALGEYMAYESLLDFIDSLQQEQQPVKRGYKDCNGCKYNRLLKDQIGWQFRTCFGGDYNGKPIAEIELCPLKTAVQQEQSDVDLEKEIDLDDEITKYWKDISSIYGAVGKEITRFDFDDACKYFYELGKNGK